MAAPHADMQRDVERHEPRRADLEVVAGHAEALEVAAQPRPERRVNRAAAEPVGGDEHGVPAAGPAERRRGALHVGAPLGGGGIVGGGHRALLGAKRLGRVAARRLDVFRIDAAGAGIGLRTAVKTPFVPLTTWAMASAPTLPAWPLPIR